MPGRLHAPLVTIMIEARPRDISARSICAGGRLADATLATLREIVAAEPDLSLAVDEGMVQLGGPDEASLDRAVDVLRSRCGLSLATSAPQAGYVEAILVRTQKDYTLKRHDGVRGTILARLILVLEPDSGGLRFESKVVGGAVPDAFVSAIADAIADVARGGPLFGFPVVASRVTLVDGAWHDRDSSAEAFAAAACAAFREALVEAGGLLEPIMRVEVLAPPDYEAGVVGDLLSRRGCIEGRSLRGEALATAATVPLANLFGYSHDLRDLTEGHGSFTSGFERYDPVPPPPREPPPAMAAAMRRP